MQKIEILRKQKNITREQLAEMVGVSEVRVAMWEMEMSTPSKENLTKLAQALGCSEKELLGLDGRTIIEEE